MALNLHDKSPGSRGLCPKCGHGIECVDIGSKCVWQNPADGSGHFRVIDGVVICSTKLGDSA